MIRHDAPREKAIALFVEVTQGLTHRFGHFRFSQMASARAAVEVSLDACRRQVRGALALVGGKIAVKLTGGAEDVLPLEFDLLKNGVWEGVSQAKRDEVRRTIFLPVWEAATVSNRDFAAAGAGRPRDSRRDAGATVGRLLLQLAWLSATPVVHCVHCAFESVTPARRSPAPVPASAG